MTQIVQAPIASVKPRRKAAVKDESLIRRTVKLKPTKGQVQELERWFEELAWIYNWAIMTIEIDAKQKKYYSQLEFQNLLTGRYHEFGIPSHVIQAILGQAFTAWKRCFKKQAKKPQRKGPKNRLRSIPFPDKTKIPEPGALILMGFTDGERQSPRARLLYKQQHGPRIKCLDESKPGGYNLAPSAGMDMIDLLPKDKLRGCRIIKKASGWYASILVAIPPSTIPVTGNGRVGLDPGFDTLLTLSNGTKIAHPKELEAGAKRLAQAQRGQNKKLTARLHETMANQRLDRNHKMSRKIVSENKFIAISNDNRAGLARKGAGQPGFGKSVASAGTGQLTQFILSKSRPGQRMAVLVDSRNSTMTCCVCEGKFGPRGKAGLKVRQWVCSGCGTHHDRDVNAAVNTLLAGLGQSHEPKEIERIKQLYLSEICLGSVGLDLFRPTPTGCRANTYLRAGGFWERARLRDSCGPRCPERLFYLGERRGEGQPLHRRRRALRDKC